MTDKAESKTKELWHPQKGQHDLPTCLYLFILHVTLSYTDLAIFFVSLSLGIDQEKIRI